MSDGPNSNSRRNFLRSSLVLISTATLAGEAPALLGNAHAEETRRFLNESERWVPLAAVDRLIPPDEGWPGAAEADVVNYIDLQMAGPWGRGEMLYRHGPFLKGIPRKDINSSTRPRNSSADPFSRSMHTLPRMQSPSTSCLPKKKTHIFQVSKRETLTLTAYRRAPSSTSCCSTRWKDSSLIRSMAATKTKSPGR